MSDIEISLYPELLRRLAAGERLGQAADDTERLAATLLAAEAIEKSSAEEDRRETAEQEKKAINLDPAFLPLALAKALPLSAGVAIGAAAKEPLAKAFRALTGRPEPLGTSEELITGLRKLLEAKEQAAAAKKKVLLAAGGGAAAALVGAKALKREDEKKSSDEGEEAKNAGSPGARALLDRIVKNFA